MRLPSVRTLSAAVLPLVVLLMFAGPAAAQLESREAIALRDQILELHHELDALRAQINAGGGGGRSYLGMAQSTAPSSSASGATSDIVAQLLDRVSTMEDEIRTLRGRVDELQNDLQQQTADLGKQIGDLKFQMQNPQAAAAGAPAPRGRPPATLPTPPAEHLAARPGGPRTPEMALKDGYAALSRHDYAAAEQAAREVLRDRASPRAYDAQYLLAQALAGQHQWSRAAIAYDDAYTRSKRGSHAADSLLGLANSLIAINERRAACDTLGKLHAEFPNPHTALREQIAVANRRAGCH